MMESIRPDLIEKATNFTEFEKWFFKIKFHSPSKGRDHRFVPCRKTPVFGIDKIPAFSVNDGWIKNPDGSLFNRSINGTDIPMDIKGFIIQDNTLFIQEETDNLIKVITVPEDIKKINRIKWLQSVCYTLTSDPDNIIQYRVRPVTEIPEIEFMKFTDSQECVLA
jgi:hypothetical protein